MKTIYSIRFWKMITGRGFPAIMLSYLFSLAFLTTQAQTDVTIGAGLNSFTSSNSATGDCGPIYRSTAGSGFDFSIHHHLFTAAELSAIPSGSTISKIAWFLNNGAATVGNAQKFNIYLKNSALTALPAPPQTFAALTTGSVLVYSSASQAIPATTGWLEFNLSSFTYTGGAIEVTIDWDISNVVGNPTTNGFAWKNDPITGRVLSYVNSVAGTSLNNARTVRAQTKFTYSGGTPCTGTPAPGNTLASINPVCPNTTTVLSLQNSTPGSGVTYQWYNGGGAITDATNSTYTATITAADDFYCDVSCGGGTPVASNLLSVTLNGFLGCYCNSAPTLTADEEIYQLSVNGASTDPLYANANGCITAAPGPGSVLSLYSNFKTLPSLTSIAQSAIIPFEIRVNECDGATYFNNGVGVWIDFNQNGLFTDVGEAVYIEPTTTPATGLSPAGDKVISGTFTVPSGAVLGTTVMRVICAESNAGAALTPCLSYFYGETEDHLVDIILNSACSGTPAPGNTIASATTVCPNTVVNFSLQNQTLGSGVTYQWFNNGGAIADATNSTYSATITLADDFYCDVSCGGGTPVASSLVSITLNSFLNCYCNSIPTSTIDEEIYQVTVNGASTDPLYANTNGCATAAPGTGSVLSRYSNFKTLGSFVNLPQGGSVPFEVRVNECDGATYFSNGVGVWVDFNQDGDFTDAGEAVYIDATTTAATGLSPGGDKVVSGTLTVPAGAVLGNTVMRVICAESFAGANLTPCLNYTYGETEDYIVNIEALDSTISFFVDHLGDSASHIVCGIFGPPATYSQYPNLFIQRSDNGMPFVDIASINIPTAVDIMTLPPTSQPLPFSGIMYTTENQPAFVLNQVIPNITSATNIRYRARYQNIDLTNRYSVPMQFTNDVINNPPPALVSNGACPAIDAVPPGYVAHNNFITETINCCVVTRQLFELTCGTFIPVVCYSSGGTDSSDCSPSCNCTNDPCCYHTCDRKTHCGCGAWVSCGAASQFVWLVTNSVNSTQPLVGATASFLSNGTITINLPSGGSNAACYKYAVNAGTTCTPTPLSSSTIVLTGLPPGNCCVRIIDTCLCLDTCICGVLPFPSLASSTSVCVNISHTLSVPLVANTIYQWYDLVGPITGATSNAYTFTVTAANDYYCTIDYPGASSTYTTNVAQITIAPITSCYCAAGATTNGCSTGDEFIDLVAFNTINNTSACPATNQYSDFTTQSTTVLQGSTYTISVNCPNFFASDQAAAWIDFNQDGLLDDATEKYTLTGGSLTTPFTGTITIPLTATLGSTRLRTRVTWTGALSSCGITGFGEVEDYTIIVDPPVANTTLNLTMFIQGYWDGTSAMLPALTNQGQGNPTTDCDSITVELHDAISPYGMLHATNSVLQTNGNATCVFTSPVTPGNYYIAVKHRNAIQTWSAAPVAISAVSTYNFSTAVTQAYGTASQVEIATGVWAFYSGDVVIDCNMDLLDIGAVETDANLFLFGYYATDLTGDGNVDLLDTPIAEVNAGNFVFCQTP